MSKIILLDACFLIEFLAVPLDSETDRHEKAVELFGVAIDEAYDVFCTLGVLYEVANHIVDIKNREAQRAIAEKFKSMVTNAWEEGIPFTIVPGQKADQLLRELAELPDLLTKYQASIRQRLSLVDCTVIEVAHSLKKNYSERKRDWPAHIWTMHGELKAMAPDSHEHVYF